MNEIIESVQKMQEYILDNYNKEITLADLSRVSLYSPWYSYRIFKDKLGISVSEYIRKLRLTKSIDMIKEKRLITDIAFEVGFDSVDGYTRAFHKEYGINPNEYRKKRIPVYLFIPYGIKFREIKRYKENIEMKELVNVFVQVLKRPKRKVIIKRGVKATNYFSYCEEVGCDVWSLLMSMESISGEPVCLWLPDKYVKENTSTYVQGVEVEVDYDGIIPNGMDVIELDECEYLMFQGEPFEEEDYCEAIMAVESSIKKYDPSFIGYEWDYENPQIQLEPIGKRGYIELKAIKKK